jgi:drug/metabolite transporter (DMT)-like permease
MISKTARGYAFISIAVLSWSFSEILQKLLQGAVPPMSKSFFRFFIGILPLGLILLIKKDFKMGFIKRNLKELLLSSILGLSIGNFVYFLGIERTKANLGSAIYGTYPLFISIYSYFLLKEHTNLKRKIIGYIIGFLATFMILTNLNFTNLINSEYMAGNLLVLVAAAIWSIYSVFGKKITKKERDLTSNIDLKFNFVAMALASISNLIFIGFMPTEQQSFFVYPLESWIYLFLLGIFVTGLGTWFFFLGIQDLEISKGISFAMFKPLFSLVLAFFILGETPSAILIIALPFVLLSIYLINKK